MVQGGQPYWSFPFSKDSLFVDKAWANPMTNLQVGVKLVKSFIVQAPEQFENSKNYLFKLDNCKQIIWRRDIQQNGTHHNDIQNFGLICYTEHKQNLA